MRYRNLGRNGATAADLLRKQTPQIKEFKADFVSVTVGGNDTRAHDWSPQRFEVEYRAILQAIIDAGADALTVAYPDVSKASKTAGRTLPLKWRLPLLRLHEVNETIRRASTEFGVTLLDMEAFPEAADPKYLSRDFAHPNALGYLRTSEAALELLAERFDLPELAPALTVSR